MPLFTHAGRTWPVDEKGFLTGFDLWDEAFAEGTASKAGIADPLSEEHLGVIRYIRRVFARDGQCPMVYQTCRENGLTLERMRVLFPAGYLRGACRLAGITYREGYLPVTSPSGQAEGRAGEPSGKLYTVDVRGFLVDPVEWDEDYATHKALEMGLSSGLTEGHWLVLRFLRDQWTAKGEVPTVYETCEGNRLSLWDLEHLFPQGYHRGAVKLAGLRVR